MSVRVPEFPFPIEAGLRPLEIGPYLDRSYVSGEPEGRRIRVAYFTHEGDGRFIAKVWFGPGAEGPPGHAHGGSISAVLDEAMGVCAWHSDHAVLARRLTVDFLRLVPLESEVTVEVSLEKAQGRKLTLRSQMLGRGGEVLAEGEGLFVELTAGAIDALRERLPPAD